MIVRILLAILGIYNALTGIFMLVAPHLWYDKVPGVTVTGPFNPHFVSDIAVAFLASGACLLLGARRGMIAATLACAGATFPALHAMVHIVGWFQHGFPTDPKLVLTEVGGVVVISALGVVLAGMHVQAEQ